MALGSISLAYLLWVVLAGMVAVKVLYEITLSPLRRFPGPFLAKLTDFYRAGLTTRGNVDHHNRQWHQKWGSAVRVGPNAISLSDPELIKVVYTSKNAWLKVR
jgi:hypothetical protein